MRMHSMRSFRLPPCPRERNLASLSTLVHRRLTMKFNRSAGSLDQTLFLFVLFVPVSLLLAGSMAVAAVAAI